jgi:DNA-binding IclR family transcriptional regulator
VLTAEASALTDDDADEPESKRRLGIQSVEIGARVLFELANCGRAVTLSELARRLDMAASNVRRYLVSLVTAGLVEQENQSLRYHLGVSSIRLGLAAMAQRPEIELAVEEARSLRDEVDCCVGVLVPGESGPVMIRWLENGDRVTHVGKIGATFSLIHSAAGRAFLAFMPIEVARAAYERETRGASVPSQAGAPLAWKEFVSMLERTKNDRMSHVRDDYTAGIEAVGAPAFNAAGEISFILTLVGRTGIFDAQSKPAAPAALKHAAERLSAILGYTEGAKAITFPKRLRLSLRDL